MLVSPSESLSRQARAVHPRAATLFNADTHMRRCSCTVGTAALSRHSSLLLLLLTLGGHGAAGIAAGTDKIEHTHPQYYAALGAGMCSKRAAYARGSGDVSMGWLAGSVHGCYERCRAFESCGRSCHFFSSNGSHCFLYSANCTFTLNRGLPMPLPSGVSNPDPSVTPRLWKTYRIISRPTVSDVRVRTALCVAGQYPRLELQSKHEKLVLQNPGIDVFMALQRGAVRSQLYELDSNKSAADPTGACYKSVSRETLLQRINASANHLSVEYYSRVEDHAVNITRSLFPQWYYNQAIQGGLSLQTWVLDHANQYHGIATCAKMIKRREREGGFLYEAVLKVRDNTLVTQPFSIPSITGGVCTKPCGFSGGVNDKVMLLHRRSMHIMTAIYEHLLHGTGSAANSETFYKQTLKKLGVNHSSCCLPLTDARCRARSGSDRYPSSGRWQTVPTWKDCVASKHPSQSDMS